MRVGAIVYLILGFCAASVRGLEQEAALKSAGIPEQSSALLEFFRQRTTPQADHGRIGSLIRQLGQGTPAERDCATAELVSLGIFAIPQLRQTVKDPDDRELAARARHCLEVIEDSSVPGAAARLLAQLKPAGATEALLAYLPFADNDTVVEEIQSALSLLAIREGQADKAVVGALRDAVPVRRAVAAAALCQAEGFTQTSLVLPLLQDPKPTVQLRAALALAERQEQEAIPVLISLLTGLSWEQARLAEDALRQIASEGAPDIILGQGETARKASQAAWAAWWQASDAASLLDYFRKRLLSEERRERILSLIRQLGDDTFEVRERATNTLLLVGAAAAPLLRVAAQSKDVEIADRAKRCLLRLEQDKRALTPTTAARLLALRKPVGSAEVLMGYLPLIEDENAAEVIREALNTVARGEAGAEGSLKRALDDKLPTRRVAAAVALCKTLQPAQPESSRDAALRQTLRQLLRDPEPTVRLRVALALADCRERDAVPVLIELLKDLPANQTWEAEQVLRWLADEQAPKPATGSSQQEASKLWAAWWQANGTKVDLEKLESRHRLLGYTLLVQTKPNSSSGQILEIGLGGQVRWQIAGLHCPVDAQVLPGNRVLIAEHYGQRVSERDFKGTILWQKAVTMPVNCQRLPNGNTFIATRNLLLEVDPKDHEVFSFSRPAHDIVSAQKLRNGQFVYLTASGQCIRLDAAGKLLTSFTMMACHVGTLEALPNGRILVPWYATNKVVELDAEGRVVWEADVRAPSAATRLANGHTLVGSGASHRLLELNRAGKIVWQQPSEGYLQRARRR